MQPDKILFIDTETGGLDPNYHSLLSLGLVVWQEFKIVDSIEVLIDDGDIKATEQALAINGIDIEAHKKKALSEIDALNKVLDFLYKNFTADDKISIGGHNVNFDVNFVRFFFNKHKVDFSKKFSHRYIDTATILYYLYLSGKLKKKAISSQEAFETFGINVDGRHTALGDAIATAKLFTLLLKMIYKKVKLKQKDINNPTLFDSL